LEIVWCDAEAGSQLHRNQLTVVNRAADGFLG
jgi:hypothetical protein